MDLSLWKRIHDLPEFYYRKAMQEIQLKRYNEAIQTLCTVLTLDPSHNDARILLGKVYAETGQFSQAIDHWKKVADTDHEKAAEVTALIEKASLLPQEVIGTQSEKPSKEKQKAAKVETTQQKRNWIEYVVLSLASLIIGILLARNAIFPQDHPQLVQAPAPIEELKTPEEVPEINYLRQVKEHLIKHGFADIRVQQKNGTVFLEGNVDILSEKYDLERNLLEIKEIPSLDMRGISVKFPSGFYYRVKAGDSLWSIAAKTLGNGNNYTDIFKTNKDVITDPSRLVAGMNIIIPYGGE